MLITFYILLGIFLYSLVAGMTYKAIANYHSRAQESKVFGAIFWPAALGIWGGILLTNTIGSPAVRASARQTRELQEANHRVKLAKLQAELTKLQAQENAELDRMLE